MLALWVHALTPWGRWVLPELIAQNRKTIWDSAGLHTGFSFGHKCKRDGDIPENKKLLPDSLVPASSIHKMFYKLGLFYLVLCTWTLAFP